MAKQNAQKQENLVPLKEDGKEKQVMEINKQMSSLEGSIEKLNKKLNTTNKQIKDDVQRLTSSDADITDKVADTYKQLGIIESTFQTLSDESQKINTDLKKVNSTIKAFEKTSSDALNSAIENQSHINAEFRTTHETLIERAQKLAKKASTISKKLDKSIKDNSKALTDLEARIVVELETIAQSSEKRDIKLDDKIQSTNEEINSQKAKMLLMQSVDEALEKRAAALEQTTQQLLADSAALKDSTESLDILTSKLSADVDALEMHTARLQQQNEEQQGLIETLQDKAESMGRSLLALADLEKKHFRALGAFSLLLMLAVIAVFFYGQYARDTESTAEALRNVQVNEQVADLQTRVQDEQMASQVFYSEITDLQKDIDAIQDKMVAMNDQVESLDGRVQYLAPLYNFGSTNTIHGSQWLSNLDPALNSIKIATVSDKQELYQIAQRYNHYFTQELAYFPTADGQYTLIYGGQFKDDSELAEAVRRMPRYINNQPVAVISNAQVLESIRL